MRKDGKQLHMRFARLQVCVVVVLTLLAAPNRVQADEGTNKVAVAQGDMQQVNRHGVGLALDLSTVGAELYGGLSGFAYRKYFGNNALQIDLMPIYADRGNELSVFFGLQFINYALVWSGKSRYSTLPTTALRLTGAASVHASRSASSIIVPDENCATPTCQQITAQKPRVQVVTTTAAGFGFEFGAIQSSGFSVAADLMMTVLWDRDGFAGAYPVPYVTGMYSW